MTISPQKRSIQYFQCHNLKYYRYCTYKTFLFNTIAEHFKDKLWHQLKTVNRQCSTYMESSWLHMVIEVLNVKPLSSQFYSCVYTIIRKGRNCHCLPKYGILWGLKTLLLCLSVHLIHRKQIHTGIMLPTRVCLQCSTLQCRSGCSNAINKLFFRKFCSFTAFYFLLIKLAFF